MDTVRSSGFDPLIAAADLYNVDDYATSVAVMDALDAGFEAYSNIGLTPSTLSNLVYNLNLDYFGKYIFAIEELASLQEDVMSALAFIPSEVFADPLSLTTMLFLDSISVHYESRPCVQPKYGPFHLSAEYFNGNRRCSWHRF